jgi:hypothetical protein
MKRPLLISLAALPVLAVGIQFVQFERTNPPVSAEPAWDSPQTRDLAKRACFDCHSNQTTWPWYSKVAPVSWLVVHHVDEGREHLNFSAIDGKEHVDEIVEEIREGKMPTSDYALLHPEARLAPAEKDALIAGLERTFARTAHAEGEHD